MDPNENLKRQGEVRNEILRMVDAERLETVAALAEELAELSEAMDMWMRGGGFIPTAWTRERAENVRRAGGAI